jgi:hypothetical protein
MNYLGDFSINATIDFKWNTQGLDGASITRATDGSIRIYKGNSATQRTSSAGITDSEDFDSLTGLHHLRIDLSDNTDSGFYAAGNEYQVVLQGAVIDGKTVNAVIASFSIERTNGVLARLKREVIDSSVNDAGPAVGDFDAASGLSASDDFYNGAVLVFTSGTLRGISRKISDYTGSTRNFAFTGATGTADAPFPTAPANADTFEILGRIG